MPQANLYFDFRNALVNTQGILAGTATKYFQDFMTTLVKNIGQATVIDITTLGPVGQGGDDTPTFQLAVNTAIKNGGGVIFIPAGTYSILTVTVPAGTVPVTFLGQGAATIINRRGDLAAGVGMFDILGSNVTFDSLVIDGQVTVPVGLLYNVDFVVGGNNDPMAPSLTKNSSIWVHGPATSFFFTRSTIQHTGGYAILLDAITGGIADCQVLNSTFTNNRPHLFGVVAGNAIYGSWTGGIYVNGDGTALNGNVAQRVRVFQCSFTRNTGNQFWQHLYGLTQLHQGIQAVDNFLEDIGLDGIEMGGVDGGVVTGNVFHRIGYVCTDDNSPSTPRWLNGLNATALDSSGLVLGVPYCDNTFISINGGCIDTDSHGMGSVTGNVMRIPDVGEPGYVEDQIANTGPTNSGNTSYGINFNNSSDTPFGAINMTIVGNTFINLPAGSLRLFALRNSLVEGNTIVAPTGSVYPPIGMGPVGPGANQRCYGNKVTHNRIDYAPVAAAPAVFEDPTYSAFTATEHNYVYGNCPISPPGSLATEFQPAPGSGSVLYLETVWFT